MLGHDGEHQGSAEDEVMVWQVDADTAAVAGTTVRWNAGSDPFDHSAHPFNLTTATGYSFEVPGRVRLVR